MLSEYKREQKQEAFRIYVTEALRIMTENTAKYAGGSMIQVKYYDIINQKSQREETKNGDEIVADIVSRAGLELV